MGNSGSSRRASQRRQVAYVDSGSDASSDTSGADGAPAEFKKYGRPISFEDLEVVKELGSGAFGQVHLMKHKSSGETFAVKTLKMDLRILFCPPDVIRQIFNTIEQEGTLLATLEHPNIVKLEAFQGLGSPKPFLAMEVCENGSLLEFAQRLKEGAIRLVVSGGRRRARMLAGVAEGMSYLESKNVVHRDLAARNVLVTEDHTCKIIDFGLTKEALSHGGVSGENGSVYIAMYTKQGEAGMIPWRWTAPEGLSLDKDGACHFSTKTDVWSFGVLLWEVMSYGELPYGDMKPEDLNDFIERGDRLEKPEGCLDDVYDIMLSCWASGPADRPSFDTLKDRLMKVAETRDVRREIKTQMLLALLLAMQEAEQQGAAALDQPEYRRTTQHSHLLQRNHKPTGWVCDVCKRTEPTSGRFRCSLGCDWDTCEDCLKKNLPTPQSCQGYTTKHEHKLAETDLATPWICDGGCGKKTAGLTRFRCIAGCDFDECSECVRKFDCREFSQS